MFLHQTLACLVLAHKTTQLRGTDSGCRGQRLRASIAASPVYPSMTCTLDNTRTGQHKTLGTQSGQHIKQHTLDNTKQGTQCGRHIGQHTHWTTQNRALTLGVEGREPVLQMLLYQTLIGLVHWLLRRVVYFDLPLPVHPFVHVREASCDGAKEGGLFCERRSSHNVTQSSRCACCESMLCTCFVCVCVCLSVCLCVCVCVCMRAHVSCVCACMCAKVKLGRVCAKALSHARKHDRHHTLTCYANIRSLHSPRALTRSSPLSCEVKQGHSSRITRSAVRLHDQQ
jgi:hypothetical protein